MNQLALLEEIAEAALELRSVVSRRTVPLTIVRRKRARLDRFLTTYQERKISAALAETTTILDKPEET